MPKGDEGISGTSTKHRDGFNSMINDALSGKIDLILTKSISRFARNTVDTLQTIRKLKEKNVEVMFEKEGIRTLDQSGELMISILGSLAQQESQNISSNVCWGIRKRFADGHTRMNIKHLIGYKVDKDGKVKIVDNEAKVVRLIYKLFMEGYGYKGIARVLNEKKIKTPADCGLWRDNTVKSILSNCKFCGDVLSQKYVTVDYLTKKQKKNEGEIPQYYVTDDHDPIVSKELYQTVQEEIKKRTSKGVSKDIIANKVYCGYCNGHHGKRIWHSNDKYRKEVYICNDKYKKETCKNVYITEEEIKKIFVNALNRIVDNKKEIIDNLNALKTLLPDEHVLINERNTLEPELAKLADKINAMVEDSAKVIDSISYDKKVREYDMMKIQLLDLNEKITNILDRKSKLDLFIKNLEHTDFVAEWTSDLWGIFLDKMFIYKDRVELAFTCGEKVSINR